MIDLAKGFLFLNEEVDYHTEANGVNKSHAFFEIVKEILIDNGDVVDLHYSPYITGDERVFDIDGKEIKKANIRVDGFNFENEPNRLSIYTLCIIDFNSEETYQNVNTSQLDASFKKAERFIGECIQKKLADRLDSSMPQRLWIKEFEENFSTIDKINIILISNNKFTGQKKEFPAREILEKRVSFQLFDLNRYVEIANSKTGQEPITINMEDYENFELPCLKTSSASDKYQSYLVSVPGGWLSSLYEDFSTRLLEQNVRTYLQARGNVNKGILNTISKEPSMFFAYNNGLTTTAASVEIGTTKDGIQCIKKLSNFQIVNGGQTTASMYYASNRAKSDLSEVFVQMKLSVVNLEVLDDVVSNISRFANTQNKVSNADFFANHPFHRLFEKNCDLEPAPRKEGSTISRYWFYERATGAYKNKTLYATAGARKTFEEKYPSNQVIKKTELAKYIVSFMGRPDIVSFGADKAFSYSSVEFGPVNEFQEKIHKFGIDWFKEAIAKTIIFRSLDELIKKSDWDEGGGTKAINITYTIAWLNRKLKVMKLSFDFNQVWKAQKISDEMAHVLEQIAKQMLIALKQSAEKSGAMTSPTQWAKKLECWEKIRKKDFIFNEDLVREFTIPISEKKEKDGENQKIQREYNEVKDYIKIACIKPSTWTMIHECGQLNDVPETPIENELMRKLQNLKAGKMPSEVEAKKIFEYLKKVNNKTDFDFSKAVPDLFV